MRRSLRRWWREAAIGAVLTVPVLALLPFGVAWLWERGAIIWWAAAWIPVATAVVVLRLDIRRTLVARTAARMKEAAPPSPDWGAAERAAWDLVETIAAETEPFTFTDAAPVRVALERTVSGVAELLRPGRPRATLHVTPAEVLLLTERTARDLRQHLVRIPLLRDLEVVHVVAAKEGIERHGPRVSRLAEWFDRTYRIARVAVNPLSGALSEIARALIGPLWGSATVAVRAEVTGHVVRAVGRAAIDLYSGRLRLSEDELRAAAVREDAAATADPVGPVRILLAGQVNAGKSSLVNALAGQVVRQTGVVPSAEPTREVRLEREGRPEVVLIDCEGIGSDPARTDAVIARARTADLVVWVVSATQPARSPDTQALAMLREGAAAAPLRRAPPVLVAVTHVDELSPAREWDPPYDVVADTRPKARAIRAALEHVAQTLAVPPATVVPVSVRTGEAPDNLDLLWALIAANLDEARRVRIDRLYGQAGDRWIARAVDKAAAAGRWLAERVT
jgi:uncharacterized protein